MKNGEINQKLYNASKGTAIIQAGFNSGIHALDPEVKEKLDLMIKCRYSPERILKQLAQRFPNVSLPSKSALYTYRKKYFEDSLVASGKVNIYDERFDIEKIQFKTVVISHLKRFVALDMTYMRDRWYKSMLKDQEKETLSKETKELYKLYMEGLKITVDTMPKLNINIEIKEEPDLSDEELEAKIEEESASESVNRIKKKYAKQLAIIKEVGELNPDLYKRST